MFIYRNKENREKNTNLNVIVFFTFIKPNVDNVLVILILSKYANVLTISARYMKLVLHYNYSSRYRNARVKKIRRT